MYGEVFLKEKKNMDTRELYYQVYSNKVNIYALRRKYKHYPDEVFFDTCELFLKYAPRVRNKWTWMVKVLNELYRQYNAEKEVKKHQEIKLQGANVSLLKQLGLLEIGGSNVGSGQRERKEVV